jgi:hypothetical protein
MKMNTKIAFVLLLLALPCAVFARKLPPEVEHAMGHGAEAKIRLKVCDDTGAPVSNASVCAGFDMLPRPHSVYGKTDTNGVCVVKGKTNGNKVVFLVGKDGYYGSRKEISYVPMWKEHDVKDGKWQPYGAVESIELRKIRNPAHLTVSYSREFNNTKVINAWIGFDLEKRDFVQPYGKGEIADLEVLFDWDGKTFADYRGIAMKTRFTEKFSGYYQCVGKTVSEFKGPYFALPDATYQQDADFYERVIIDPNAYGRRYDRRFFDENKCWIVRSRCKVDAEGNLVSAHYSIVNNIEFCYDKGGVVCICVTGAFNPTPNDTNLEDIVTAERARHFIRQCEPPPPPRKKKRKSLWPF